MPHALTQQKGVLVISTDSTRRLLILCGGYNCESTAVRLPFDCSSTAQRPFKDIRWASVNKLCTAACSEAASVPRLVQVVTTRHPERPGDLDLWGHDRSCRWCGSSALSRLVTLTCDILTLELVRIVSRGTDNLLANFGVSATATFRCPVIGKHTICLTTWPYYLDLWRHRACRRCGSSYSIPVSSLKFVGLPFWRYGTFSVSVLIGLETSWLWTLRPLNGVTGHPCHELPFWQFSASCALPFSTQGQARDRRTDRRQPSTLNAPTYGVGVSEWVAYSITSPAVNT